MAPLHPRISETGRCTTRWFPATPVTLSPSVLSELYFCQGPTTRCWHRPFFNTILETRFRSGMPPLHRGRRLGQAKWKEDFFWAWATDRLNETIIASLTRSNSVLEIVKKVELWSQDFTMPPESIIKKTCYHMNCITSLSRHSIVPNVNNLVNSCTS